MLVTSLIREVITALSEKEIKIRVIRRCPDGSATHYKEIPISRVAGVFSKEPYICVEEPEIPEDWEIFH